MQMNFNIDNNDFEKETNIKVVGVGGGGGNAVNRMVAKVCRVRNYCHQYR